MKQQIKEDWIINNQNVFGLSKEISLTFFTIQCEMLDQLEGKKINSISDYLGTKIDVAKNIRLTKSLTIQRAFEEFLGFDVFKPLKVSIYNCSMILAYLQLSLLEEYNSRKHKNILTFSEYENKYSILLNGYLSSNIDTNERDFIKAELTLCDNLISELMKPIYNEISLFKEVLDEPCDFKRNLINSIDKRKKFLEQKANEKIPKIKALFKLIEYLHSNIDNFNLNNDLIKELELLNEERQKVNHKNTFKDKLKYDEVQAEIETKFKILQDNTASLIKAKAKELNVCNFDNEPNYSFNGVQEEIRQLKENFLNKDLPEIFKYKSQYLKYRTSTHKTFLSLQFFFDELDKITKSLFDYFKETEYNEFKSFETKDIHVNSIEEAIKGFKQGHTKFTLPYTLLNPSNIQQQNNIEPLPPQSLQPETEVSQQNKEIEIYLKSYDQYHFDEVIIKRNEDGTPNNIYLGNNFNEWLTNIDRNLLANKSYDAEIQDKLSTYNKYLLFLAEDLIGLYKAVSGYEKTNNRGYITSIHIQENKALQRLESIKFYSEIVKHYIRNKQFQKANDIKDYCIALFDNCVYNLNDVLFIDIYKSPLKTHFENIKTSLESSINFYELKIIKDLETNTSDTPQHPPKSENLYTPKPCFKAESIQSITDTLNVFFDATQHAELKRIIETGGKAKEKLLFRDNSNRLTDYFKRLIESDIIVGCNKTVLKNWIVDNFKYINGKTQKNFTPKTVEKTLSSKEQLCKNPII
ncbi:hypothetical protein SGQ44_13585 [Flavobacterium sp. Fl-77]|uniref:Uncharacterized protein n=1 Tax=Flavobacterium flavipigmentatum TaxID=2893884 RepID=A0AAJ2VZ16_9FLAO|nr:MULTISPECIES: hypothetical protein [unclassified Flavobacterium]MDX6183137.1 hypothetical protein [Flavobacterium sp. Fl-33]MDX6186794.1 hypothetical protein [Flavobacterium sp. Fl-77]UFH40448.1 hypothetical protein LNP22_09265 [Flavobacterium sp. F-70]